MSYVCWISDYAVFDDNWFWFWLWNNNDYLRLRIDNRYNRLRVDNRYNRLRVDNRNNRLRIDNRYRLWFIIFLIVIVPTPENLPFSKNCLLFGFNDAVVVLCFGIWMSVVDASQTHVYLCLLVHSSHALLCCSLPR